MVGKYVSLGVARDEVSPCSSEDRWVKVRMIAVGQIVSFRTNVIEGYGFTPPFY